LARFVGVGEVGCMHRKHVPQRTCVGCRKTRPKREMVRIVRTPDQEVKIDESGKAPGRGAYLCRERRCWERALSEKRLEYALKTGLSKGEREALLEFGQSLELTDEAGKG
jgi:predicted RNA-binding protein YlxR (DUF448 family)